MASFSSVKQRMLFSHFKKSILSLVFWILSGIFISWCPWILKFTHSPKSSTSIFEHGPCNPHLNKQTQFLSISAYSPSFIDAHKQSLLNTLPLSIYLQQMINSPDDFHVDNFKDHILYFLNFTLFVFKTFNS